MVDVAAADDERTSAQGLFVFGDSYLASAIALKTAELPYGHADSPIRFLLYHATELYLKAFIRAAGTPLADVKKLGHEFRKLLRASKRLGLVVPETARAPLLFSDRTDDAIESRYVRTGFRRGRPTLIAIAHAAVAIRKAVRESEIRRRAIVLRGERNGDFGAELEQPWE